MSFAATSSGAACGRRALILTAAAFVACLCVLFGGAGGASATSLATSTTATTLSVSPSSAGAGEQVTFSSTVSAPNGTVPTGYVDISAQYTAPGATASTYVDITQPNLSSGTSSSTASASTTTLQAGSYQVTATYNPAGSPLWISSSSSTVTLTVGSVPPQPTTSLSLTESAQTIAQTQSVTLTSTLSTAAGELAPTGSVRFSAGPDVNDLTTVGTGTISNGTASLTKGGWEAGDYVIVAYYDGDSVYVSAKSTQVSLTVTPVSSAVSTTTTVTLSPGTIADGALVTISAHIVKVGTPNPPPGGPIVSFIGGPLGSDPSSWVRIGMPGQTTLDANGDASETVGGWSPGQYTIVAQYPGDTYDASSMGTATLTVIPHTGGTPTLTYTGATSAPWNGSAALSGMLTAPGGIPIPGETVTFTLGADSCNAVTDAHGSASCAITVSSPPGGGTVVASSFGDSTYPGVRTAQGFTITPRPTTLTAANVSAPAGGTASLSATLVDRATSAPISGETVSLKVGSDTCSATTDRSGLATCGVPASEGIGAHGITAGFAGDTAYAASGGTGTLTIVPPATTTKLVPVAAALQGSSVTLGATLTTQLGPVSGETLTLALGAATCTGVTNASGVATCAVTASGPVGPTPVTASFAGDAVYEKSADTGSAIVYAFAPGGGSFVVGDRSASGTVTFWGAGWAKLNSLSGGAAPDGFKGFALESSSKCNVPWSTDPGNSSPPPAGPLPAYMAVIVASSSAKSGSAISGSVVGLVIVQTNAGYKGDPGHAGTGTVVATISCGG